MRKYLDRKTVFVPLFCRLFSLCVVSPLFQWVLCGNQHNHKVQEAPASKSQENALAEASSGASTYCSKVYCWQCISQFSGIFWSWSFLVTSPKNSEPITPLFLSASDHRNPYLVQQFIFPADLRFFRKHFSLFQICFFIMDLGWSCYNHYLYFHIHSWLLVWTSSIEL